MKRAILAAAVSLLSAAPLPAQSIIPIQPEALKHWRDAQFGMFIHWGPVSLTGKEIGWSRGAGTPVEEYDKLYQRFNPTAFNADEWVSTAKAAGMKYVVLTTKHHDGFCLWDSKVTDYDITATPFKRDVVRELSAACKKGGIPFGVYYSTCDWHHPDFPLTSPGGKTVRPTSDLDRYTEYLKAQTRELLSYGPLFTIWYDVPQKFDAARGASVINMARAIQPDIVINDRSGHPGDYDTPEQKFGGFQLDRPWETCMTLCNQWAWKPGDPMNSLEQCLHTLIRTNGGDGNLLFNVGPEPTGIIEPRQVERLKEMGAWLAKHGHSLHATRGGPWKPTESIVSTRKADKIYLHLLRKTSAPVTLPALPMEIRSATLLDGAPVPHQSANGTLTLTVPESAWEPNDTIIELTVSGNSMDIPPLEIPAPAHRHPGRAVSNTSKLPISHWICQYRLSTHPHMNTEIDTLARRVDKLESQNRRLRLVTFAVWPAAFAVITVLLLLPGKMDLGAMKYLLGCISGVFVMLVITLFLTMVCWFLLKLATDFKNRHSRMHLNPGSRGTSPAGRP